MRLNRSRMIRREEIGRTDRKSFHVKGLHAMKTPGPLAARTVAAVNVNIAHGLMCFPENPDLGTTDPSEWANRDCTLRTGGLLDVR